MRAATGDTVLFCPCPSASTCAASRPSRGRGGAAALLPAGRRAVPGARGRHQQVVLRLPARRPAPPALHAGRPHMNHFTERTGHRPRSAGARVPPGPRAGLRLDGR
ncbi:hypothetical protein LV779_09020 [Streptomyces thinghirensis]|nr:hypothetical protein [Streptomyces thinghirensis]